MQCSSYYRDPYEAQAWELYLREGTLRAAREEVAFLEATGGATFEEIARIRGRVLGNPDVPMAAIKIDDDARPSVTVSLKSVLLDLVHEDGKANQLCRRVKPMLEQAGIHTFRKHQATYVLKNDVGRIRDLALSRV